MEKVKIILIGITIIILILFSLQVFVLLSRKEQKWKAILDPSNANYNSGNNVFFNEEKKSKKKNVSLKEKIKGSRFYKKWYEKFTNLYWQAGQYDKTFDDFVSLTLKMTFLGIMYALLFYLIFENLLVSILPALFFAFVPFLLITSKISSRKSEFRENFPFFLKTLSFVLQNGANPSVAIVEVTEKLKEGVLKECMTDVIIAQKLNGGNFVRAFEAIKKKIILEEVEDFISILQNNEEKGVGIAESFLNQSDMLTRILNNKKNKKINSVENKILLPVILIVVALVLLVLSL